MHALTVTLLTVTLSAAAAVPLSAQWEISAEIGVARFGGSSRDSTGTRVGPYRPTTLALRLGRGVGRARVALAVLRAKTGLAAEGPTLAVVQYDIGTLWEIAPEVSVRVASFGTGAEARVDAGPAIDLWDFDGERRSRWGGRAGVSLEWPLARVLAGYMRLGGVVTGSVFDAADVPDGVERVATRRVAVAIGLRYRM
jgi:hypothetical protein